MRTRSVVPALTATLFLSGVGCMNTTEVKQPAAPTETFPRTWGPGEPKVVGKAPAKKGKKAKKPVPEPEEEDEDEDDEE